MLNFAQLWFSVLVIMCWIHSRHFQIFGKNEYWRIPYVKVSSHDYSSIYARMPENVTNIRYSPILSHPHVRCRLYAPNTFSALPICGIDEYWRIPYMKVSSLDYSSIYTRTPENVDKYLVFANCFHLNVYLWCEYGYGRQLELIKNWQIIWKMGIWREVRKDWVVKEMKNPISCN